MKNTFRNLTAFCLTALLAFACGTEDKSTSTTTSDGGKTVIPSAIESAVVSTGSATQVALPTDWDTEFSQKLEIKLLAQYDSSGEAGWDAAAHPNVYVSTNGPGYGGFLSATVTAPGLVIIDSDTYEVVIEKQFTIEGLDPKFYNEDHGIGVSMDGNWIYLVTGDSSKPVQEAGRLFIINARTLKLDKVLQTSSYPHHVKIVEYYDGEKQKDYVLVENFNWNLAPRMAPGSGIYLLDPSDNNRITGGFRSDTVQGNPYLAFPHPGGRYLFAGLPPGAIGDPDIKHNIEGMLVVVDMKTWKTVKFWPMGFDPIWTVFSADGQYTWHGDGGSDEIFKIDNTTLKEIATSRSAVHGAYGIHLNWTEDELFVVEKGEASHNRGKNIGLVDPVSMKPLDIFQGPGLRGDHALIHPSPARNEMWISYNSSFSDVVFDMGKHEVKKEIKHTGSSHNGAFVKYSVNGDGSWTGEVQSDQAGLHGAARTERENMLGVSEIVFKSEKVSVNAFR